MLGASIRPVDGFPASPAVVPVSLVYSESCLNRAGRWWRVVGSAASVTPPSTVVLFRGWCVAGSAAPVVVPSQASRRDALPVVSPSRRSSRLVRRESVVGAVTPSDLLHLSATYAVGGSRRRQRGLADGRRPIAQSPFAPPRVAGWACKSYLAIRSRRRGWSSHIRSSVSLARDPSAANRFGGHPTTTKNAGAKTENTDGASDRDSGVARVAHRSVRGQSRRVRLSWGDISGPIDACPSRRYESFP